MICASCNHENRPAAKFCEECAAPLQRSCASCGSELRPTAKFCDECGSPTTSQSKAAGPKPKAEGQTSSAGTRKIVSIIFADLMGSTALQERLDPESVNRVMDAYYQAVRGPVEAAGGTVVQLLGDGVLCAFGIPQIAQDDALRAVRAAMGIQQAFREFLRGQQWLSVPIGLRVAVNTGEVVVSDEHPAGIGDPLNVAARLQQEARDGEVLIGQSTRRLVVDAVTLEQAGVFALKGRAESVKAYRVVSLERPAGVAAAAFVGRDEELARISSVYEAAVAKSAAHLAVLVGSPGLGKSRLIHEVTHRLGDSATVIAAQCDAAGGATFAPVAEALRKLLGATRADRTDPSDPTDSSAALEAVIGDSPERARIVAGISAVLAGSPASPEETFFVVRRFLAALAATKPVILIIDDLHWAEPLLLDLVEHLVQWGSGVPLLILVGARPELRERRSSLATAGNFVADVVTLSGLDAGAAMRLAANVIGAADLPSAIVAKVLATSEGNPLFVGELVRMLVDEGAIEKQGERWIVGANLAALEMPPTIHALLAARIERLRPEERGVLECAAVVGRHFSRGAVAALLGQNGDALDARLEALRRTELIERDTGWLLGEPVLRFHHVLIRDAAYRRLLKGTRAELHERLADWIAAKVGETAEHDETIGWHLEQAHQHLREIGPLDAKGRSLGERAADRLAAAGKRALAGDDVALAANLLGRAIDRRDADDIARAELALDWCEALLSAGDVSAAAKAIDELGRFATSDGSDRLRAWHTCFSGQLTALTAPQQLQATADAVAAAAEDLAKLGDAAGEAKAHSVRAQALARLGKVGACEAALDQALAAARKAGDRRRANAVLAGAPVAALWGPSPVTRASGRCLDVVRVLRITQGAPAVESVALSCQGVLEALRGRTDAARRMLASSRKMVEELGIAHRLFEADVFAGRIELLEGDAAGAERLLRGAYEGLRDLGLGIDAARAGALLAHALLAQDRVDEAEALSHESEQLAGDDLQAAIAWRGVRAEALAKRGEHGAAVDLARAAVAIASATDALLDHADARLALATALRADGHGAQADAEDQRALELWEAKGATLLVERARAKPYPVEPASVKPMPRPGSAEAESRSGRRVRPNTATAMVATLVAAVAARDFDGITRETPEDFESIDHPSGASYGREAVVASLRRLFRSRDPHYEVEPIATLGELLVLGRRRTRASGTESGRYDVGPYENEAFELFEANASGKSSRTEVFAADHLGDAIVRLYERYADLLPEGPARTRAARVARSIASWNGPVDFDHFAAAYAPSLRNVDHRFLGTWSARNREEIREHFRLQLDLAPDFAGRFEEVFAADADGLVARMTFSGPARNSGGRFENRICVLLRFGGDGRVTHSEVFEAEQEGEALARFDELVLSSVEVLVAGAGEPQAEPFANAASASAEPVIRCLIAHDWNGFRQLFAEDFHMSDRRRLVQLELDRDPYVAFTREVADGRAIRNRWEMVATRGDRLALTRSFYEFTDVDVGPSEIAFLLLMQVDERGRIVANVRWDVDDLDAAYAELDARYAAGEGAAYRAQNAIMAAFERAVVSRDWDPMLALCAPEFIEHDHRSLAVLGTTRGAAAWAQNFRTLVDLAPDTTYRVDHFRSAPRGFCSAGTWVGSREGGPYEIPLVAILELDDRERLARADIYDPDQLDQALARFAEIAGRAVSKALPQRFANAATRALERGTAALGRRDWDGFASLFAADFRIHDRTARIESDASQWLPAFREMVGLTSGQPERRVLATRGDRLMVGGVLWHGAEGDVGPSEVEWLLLIEVDARGDHLFVVSFNPGDVDAAYAEIDARWALGEATAYPAASKWLADYLRYFAARDWSAMTALFTPDVLGENHRLVGWGTLHGPAGIISTLQAQIELAPDTRERVDHVRTGESALLFEYAWLGTREGGSFENVWLVVVELDADGRARRADVWEAEQLAEALARFEELAAGSR